MRTRMPVTMDGKDYPAANAAFRAAGLTTEQYRPLRIRLRIEGRLEFTVGDRIHHIARQQ